MACGSVWFLHHPRTGGTYTKRLMTQHGLIVSGGHYYKIDVGVTLEVVTMTILRDPVQRVVSYLAYMKNVPVPTRARNRQNPFWREAGWRSLDDLIGENEELPELQNAVCRRMSGHKELRPDSLNAAIRNLERLTVVGIAPHYDQLMEALSHACGRRVIETDSPRNASRPEYKDLFEERHLEWIAKNNTLDGQIYQYALEQGLMKRRRKCNCTAKFRNIIHGAVGQAKSKMGIGWVGVDVIKKRRAICRACDHRIPCKNTPSRICGCQFCPCKMKDKTRLKSESCPVGKW